MDASVHCRWSVRAEGTAAAKHGGKVTIHRGPCMSKAYWAPLFIIVINLLIIDS
jgi:hypothetical protein